jgi:hypothetical protein
VPPCAAGLGEAGAAGKLLQFFTPDGAAPATQPTALALCWTPTHLWLGALLDGSADPAGLADAECAGSVGELEHDDSVALLLSPGLANSSGWAYGAVGRGEGGEGGRHVVANVKGKGHTGRVLPKNSVDCAAEGVLASVTPRQGVRGGWRASLAMPWGLFASDDHYPIYGEAMEAAVDASRLATGAASPAHARARTRTHARVYPDTRRGRIQTVRPPVPSTRAWSAARAEPAGGGPQAGRGCRSSGGRTSCGGASGRATSSGTRRRAGRSPAPRRPPSARSTSACCSWWRSRASTRCSRCGRGPRPRPCSRRCSARSSRRCSRPSSTPSWRCGRPSRCSDAGARARLCTRGLGGAGGTGAA